MLAEHRTVGALLAHLAQAIPQQEAIVFPPQRLTYLSGGTIPTFRGRSRICSCGRVYLSGGAVPISRH